MTTTLLRLRPLDVDLRTAVRPIDAVMGDAHGTGLPFAGAHGTGLPPRDAPV